MEKNPEIQFRSPEDIKSYQEEQLAKVLAYLQAHSKFNRCLPNITLISIK